jgi:hypothetical protein
MSDDEDADVGEAELERRHSSTRRRASRGDVEEADGEGRHGKRKSKPSKSSRKQQLRAAREAQSHEIEELKALLAQQAPPEALTLDDLKGRQPAEFFAAATVALSCLQLASLPHIGTAQGV